MSDSALEQSPPSREVAPPPPPSSSGSAGSPAPVESPTNLPRTTSEGRRTLAKKTANDAVVAGEVESAAAAEVAHVPPRSVSFKVATEAATPTAAISPAKAPPPTAASPQADSKDVVAAPPVDVPPVNDDDADDTETSNSPPPPATERDPMAASTPFASDAQAALDLDDVDDSDGGEPGPATPPVVLSDEDLLRQRLRDAAAFLNAQVDHATPSPASRREKATAAQELALGMANARHLEEMARQQRLQRRSVAPASTPPPHAATGEDSLDASPVRDDDSRVLGGSRRAKSTTPQQRLTYDWSAVPGPKSASDEYRSPVGAGRRPTRLPPCAPMSGASSPIAPPPPSSLNTSSAAAGGASSPHTPNGRRLPPLDGAPSPLGTSSSAHTSSDRNASQSRLKAAALAYSTHSRVNVAEDERLRFEVALAHALERNSALATEHAAASAQYATWVAHKKALEEQTADHRALSFQLRTELRLVEAQCIEAERQSLAWHAQLRDLSLKLQRSRLKQTSEERQLLKELTEARAQLRELRQVGQDEDAAFEAAMASRTRRAAILEDQIRHFDPTAFVERCELDELQAEMQQRNVVNLSAPSEAAKPGGTANAKVTIANGGADHHVVDTSSPRFKTFHYTEGAEWATNNAPLPPPVQTAEASPPPESLDAESTGGDTSPGRNPKDGHSSVKVLKEMRGRGKHGKHHPNSSAASPADDPPLPGDLEIDAIVAEHQQQHLDGDTTKPVPGRAAAPAVATGPPPPSMRLERALDAYKSALVDQQQRGAGAKAHQARLKKFLKGEF